MTCFCALRYNPFYKQNQAYQKSAIIEIIVPKSFVAPLDTVCSEASKKEVPNEERAQVYSSLLG